MTEDRTTVPASAFIGRPAYLAYAPAGSVLVLTLIAGVIGSALSCTLGARPVAPLAGSQDAGRTNLPDDRWTDQIAGTVELSSALGVTYRYDFNRNAIEDGVVGGGGLIALTESGCLLRFDIHSMRRTNECFGDPPATCLGRGPSGGVLVGLSDGSICRVNPESLTLTRIAGVGGLPVWVGAAQQRQGGEDLVAVLTATRSEETTSGGVLVHYEVHDLATAKSTSAWKCELGPYTRDEVLPAAALLDSSGRLWLGGNSIAGDAALGFVDLRRGDFNLVPGATEGVYGFVDSSIPDEIRTTRRLSWEISGFLEFPDGQVWAYGGSVRPVLFESFVARVDRGTCEVLWKNRSDSREEDNRPRLGIDRMICSPLGDSLLVFSGDDIYRGDRGFGKWRHLHDQRLFPDSWFRGIRALHVYDFDASDFLIAGHGFVRVHGQEQAIHTIEGQLETREIDRVLPTSEGSLLVPCGSASGIEEPPWLKVVGQWRARAFVPASTDADSSANDRYDCHIMPDGRLLTLALADYPERFVIARWEGSKAEILLEDDSRSRYAIPEGVFPTPDGEIWYAWHDGIARLVNGEWQRVAEGIPRPWGGYRVINPDGPPWIFRQEGLAWMLHRDKENPLPLRRLAYQHPIRGATIEEFPLVGESPPVTAVYDALSWERGVMLLAADAGLRFCDTATGALKSVSFPIPADRVWCLFRDCDNRLWLGGQGLWVCDLNEQKLYGLSQVPVIGKRRVSAIGPDSGKDGGVIVALGDHGVVSLRVISNAAPR